jgi:hypothetical protein
VCIDFFVESSSTSVAVLIAKKQLLVLARIKQLTQVASKTFSKLIAVVGMRSSFPVVVSTSSSTISSVSGATRSAADFSSDISVEACTKASKVSSFEAKILSLEAVISDDTAGLVKRYSAKNEVLVFYF